MHAKPHLLGGEDTGMRYNDGFNVVLINIYIYTAIRNLAVTHADVMYVCAVNMGFGFDWKALLADGD